MKIKELLPLKVYSFTYRKRKNRMGTPPVSTAFTKGNNFSG